MGSEDIAIKVENISKIYRIGMKEKIHDSLGSAMFEFIKSPLSNYRKYRSLYKFDDVKPANDNNQHGGNSSDIVWALRDVCFAVKKGEALGIIGANGAGKSTLLKILSRITDPTSGYAEFRGRISSLLEVGTGFHPELTGTENIYLNGIILGMKKSEVKRKFDEIVDFSGVAKFLDTPVKRYSSGMRVRLAFAVAAHLNPDILIIDEVLAVGDSAFQKKCIKKMDSVSKGGRTVLFVSHNMGAITQFCGRAIWLDAGCLKMVGPSHEVVTAYMGSTGEAQSSWQDFDSPEPETEVKLRSVRVLSRDGRPIRVIPFNHPFQVEISYDVLRPIQDLSVSYQVFNSEGIMVFEAIDTDLPKLRGITRPLGHYVAVCQVPSRFIKPGSYVVSVVSFIERMKTIERRKAVVGFDISEAGYSLNAGRMGVITPVLEWEVRRGDRTFLARSAS